MAKEKKIESEASGLVTMFKLKEKENEFHVTREGPFEYHHFQHGILYSIVPEEEAEKFESVILEAADVGSASVPTT